MIKKLIVTLAACGVVLAGSTASAATISVAFPSATSTVISSSGFLGGGEMGYFWSVVRGDSIEETFVGTGLASVDALDLTFDVTQNVLDVGAFVNWNVLLNGIVVGSWSWSDTDGTGANLLAYAFPSIAGMGTYTVRMEVTNEVAPGDGSIAIGYPGEAQLTSSAVPEPATLILLGGGVAAVLAGRRKRRS